MLNTAEVEKLVDEEIQRIRNGKVRNHKLKGSALSHEDEVEEQEYDTFLNFLITRNYFLIDELQGVDNV